jgi:hypothetical protein
LCVGGELANPKQVRPLRLFIFKKKLLLFLSALGGPHHRFVVVVVVLFQVYYFIMAENVMLKNFLNACHYITAGVFDIFENFHERKPCQL